MTQLCSLQGVSGSWGGVVVKALRY